MLLALQNLAESRLYVSWSELGLAHLWSRFLTTKPEKIYFKSWISSGATIAPEQDTAQLSPMSPFLERPYEKMATQSICRTGPLLVCRDQQRRNASSHNGALPVGGGRALDVAALHPPHHLAELHRKRSLHQPGCLPCRNLPHQERYSVQCYLSD